MLASVDITAPDGDVLSLNLTDTSNGYEVQGIDGLDPVQATLVTSSYAQMDGAFFQNAQRSTRNIVLHLGYEPDWVDGVTVEILRKALYEWFSPKAQCSLTFNMDDGSEYGISAYVESFTAPLFAQDPTADISLICMDPDFYDMSPTILAGNSTNDGSEFLISYDGSVESGIDLVLDVNQTLGDFTIYNRRPDGIIDQLDFSYSMVAGNVLEINTMTGSKSATLNDGTNQFSVLYAIDAQSAWVNLYPGDNYLQIYADSTPIPYTLTYTQKYGGL